MRVINFPNWLWGVVLLLTAACGKNGGDTPVVLANLQFDAVVSTDKSGNVSFTATAENASSYEFDFGNGVFQTSTTGTVNYKYPAGGNYTVKVTAKGANGSQLSKSKEIVVDVALALVWSDEFDGSGAPSSAKWVYDIGTGSGGWGNNEKQYYTDRATNSYVSNGTLKIVAKKEAYSGSEYTSARLKTQGKYSVQYGKLEMRAKLPVGGGTWPAFWMLGDNINTVGWPACGEIDIMEHVGNNANKIFATLHYTGNSGGNGVTNTTMVSTATSDFHVYTAEWTAASIKFYVDGTLFHTFANNSSLPFNQKFFIILNFAMGGNFGGAIDPNFTEGVYEIDYVRVYQ